MRNHTNNQRIYIPAEKAATYKGQAKDKPVCMGDLDTEYSRSFCHAGNNLQSKTFGITLYSNSINLRG